MYIDGDYAHSRLLHTLVRHNDVPVQVLHVSNNLMCCVSEVLGRSVKEYTVHLDELVLSSPPLGFVNGSRGCTYLCRKPMRRDWRQGLRVNTTVAQTYNLNNLDLELIALCMKGKFPKKSTALKKLRAGAKEVAISREFSLSREGNHTMISYKWYGVVGRLTAKGAKLDLMWEYLLPVFKGVV